MNAPHPAPEPQTIDVTLDGTVLAAPTIWSRLAGVWRSLPPGSAPLLAAGLLVALTLAVLLLGALLVAVPVLLGIAIVSALLRGPRRPVR